MPDGSLARFRFVEAPIMEPALAAKFPELKTYLGQGIDDPLASVRFDLTPAGFHAQILSPNGAIYIDPYWHGYNDVHISYYKHDYHRLTNDFQCLTATPEVQSLSSEFQPMTLSGGILRTYRLACAATGEYTQFHGGTVPKGMAAIVTAINRVTGIYETEVAIRLVLVANNDLIVYTNSNADPYNNSSGSTMLNQNQSNLDSVIGSGNYDIGHVFSTGGGGIAGLGVACVAGRKANGVTGLAAPTGDPFYIDYVAHEMGHQFGAYHSFNSTTGNCGGGNRTSSSAYEPGSGSTIMAYAGICGADDLQPHSDPYFLFISLDQIVNYTTLGSGSLCPVVSPTGNNLPSVSAGANFTIPKGTPFTLTASGSDSGGDTLTYCWEERDLGPSITLTTPDNGSSPLFRSFNPTLSSSRTFPRVSNILNHTTSLGEMLPTTARTMNFRVTARDNRPGGGGINTADMQVSVATNAGPFVISSPNTAVTWSNLQTVTWNVAGTAGVPVNATNVDILLSTDGGLSFPIVLASAVPNSGSQAVLIPNLTSSTARIKVQASDNIFFDISDSNFSIIPAIPSPLLTLNGTTLLSESCPDNAVDPGETVTVDIALRNIGNADTTNLVVTMVSTNGITSATPPQSYGTLIAGAAAVSRSFTFSAIGTCGGTLGTFLLLQDGTANLGTLAYDVVLGNVVTVTTAFSNATSISIPAPGDTRGAAAPYPSAVSVAGLTGMVTKVTVTLNRLAHSAPDDVDVLLVGPNGQSVLLISDTGDGNSVADLVLTFDDDAAASLPNSSALISGTYKPTNFDTSSDAFPSPAPAAPFGTSLSAFNGMNPNGTWSLYVQDDAKQSTGTIVDGWTLTLTTSNTTCCSSGSIADLALNSLAEPTLVNLGSNITFRINLTNLGPDMANNVTVTDALPADVNLVSASSSQGNRTTNNNLVGFAVGTLTNGQTATLTVTVLPNHAGLFTNRVWTVSSQADPNTANNSVQVIARANAAPSMSSIPNQTITKNNATSPIAFTISDMETAADALTVSGSSSDTNLVPDANLVFNGGGSNRTVTITPTPDRAGTSTITINVSDGLAGSNSSFLLTVNAPLEPPVLDTPRLSNDLVILSWSTVQGHRYQVQYLDDWSQTNWVDLAEPITATGSTAAATDTLSTNAQRFYRVALVP